MVTTVGTRASTVTVNAAFLQEIKEVNEELWRGIATARDICSSAVTVHEQATPLVELLLELRDQLALHFALEEAYGYFEDPLLVVPVVAQQASKLRAEHRQLYLAFCQIAEYAEQLLREGNSAEFVIRVPGMFWDFHERLQRHESFENELIMRQFDDLGTGD